MNPGLIAAWTAALSIVFLAAVHARPAADLGDTTTESSAPRMAAVSPTAPVATVNGRVLDETLFQAYRRQRWGQHFQSVDSATAVDGLITTVLLAEAALEAKLDTQPVVAAELRAQQILLLASAAVDYALSQQSPTEQDLLVLYREEVKSRGEVEYHARHILVGDEVTAHHLIQQLVRGAAFSVLAAEHSLDSSAVDGGDLGWFNNVDVPESIAAALAASTQGQVYPQPVHTEAGWHVLELIDRRDIPPPSFDGMKEELRAKWRHTRVNAYIDELRRKAAIDLPQPGLGNAP